MLILSGRHNMLQLKYLIDRHCKTDSNHVFVLASKCRPDSVCSTWQCSISHKPRKRQQLTVQEMVCRTFQPHRVGSGL